MRRRDVIRLAAGLPLLGAPLLAWQREVGAADTGADAGTPFDAALVRRTARELAAHEYRRPDRTLPPELDKLSYDDYRNIRFRPERALWRDTDGRFQVQLLPRGFLFRERVEINVVADGRSRPVAYAADDFRFDHGLTAPDPALDIGVSGFRLHSPMNSADVFDEVAVFQGASYFRAIAKGQTYGTSARGLAIDTGAAEGEEFPLFKAYWLEVPRPGADSVVVHALLDSPSAAAAYRFTILPGETTTMAVEMTLYPRADLARPGIAPLTSMFLFGPNDRVGVDDFRPAVRDASGLEIANGHDETLWRPLANPQRLQISVFAIPSTRGFGLMQRQRSFFDYQDLEARYERRPSVWVEPIGDWGPGAVHLVEIPTPEEIHDNIVAFWRPKAPLAKGGEYSFTYRLHWGWGRPGDRPPYVFGETRLGGDEARRRFVVDVVGAATGSDVADLAAEVTTSAGKIVNIALYPNPEIDGLRLAFDLDVGEAELAELRAQILRDGRRLSEVWVYRWTP